MSPVFPYMPDGCAALGYTFRVCCWGMWENSPGLTSLCVRLQMPINDWYRKGDRKAGKKGRGFFSCFNCFSA